MNLAVGSWRRFALAALLAPAAPLVLLGAVMFFSRSGFPPRLFVLWLVLIPAIAVIGLSLRAWGKTRLRHHLIAALGTGIAFTLGVLLLELVRGWSRTLEAAPSARLGSIDAAPPVEVHNPYACQMSRAFDDGFVVLWMLLLFGASLVTYKWLYLGNDTRPVTRGWRIAGGVYLVALLVGLTDLVVTARVPSAGIGSWVQQLICGS
jgi:hypothetical protein